MVNRVGSCRALADDLVTSRKGDRQVLYAIDHDNVVECCGKLFAKLEVMKEICEL